MKNARGDIFSRPFMGERVPQHIQNLVIRDYCDRNKLNYLLSVSEYSMENCYLILQNALDELKNKEIEGLVAYSIFQMPQDDVERNKIFSKIIKMEKTIHFSVERLSLSNEEDKQRIENIWLVKKTLPFCLSKF